MSSDPTLLCLVILACSCGAIHACKLPDNPQEADYIKYVMCLHEKNGFETDAGRWGRSVDKKEHSNHGCELKGNPQTEDYIYYAICLQKQKGYAQDGGRWGRSVENQIKRNFKSKRSEKQAEECKLKQPPAAMDYIAYAMCLSNEDGYTADAGRFGRSVDVLEKNFQKRKKCELKQPPQTNDYIMYVLCLQNGEYTTEGGRWGRSVDSSRLSAILKNKMADKSSAGDARSEYPVENGSDSKTGEKREGNSKSKG